MNLTIRKSDFLIALLFLFSSSVLASAESDFSKGLEFFRSGDYSSAVVQFELARKQGMNSVAIHYNLASSYYKLEKYELSRRYFKLVSQSPKMSDLAEYNLGLIELKVNNRKQAKKYFSEIVKDSKDKKLVSLSVKQLRKIKNMDDKWRAYFSLNMGNDDNITASPVDAALDVSDTFYDVFLSLDTVISGKRKDGWLADVIYFKIDYSDSDFYDEYQYAAGLRKEQRLGSWDTSAHLSVSNSNFGGIDYQSALKLDVKGKTSLTKTKRLYLRYRYEDISSDEALFSYLEGWRQRARIDYRDYQKNSSHQLYYEYELNDRGELITSTYAYDYSPTRHTIRGKYTFNINSAWAVTGDLSYRVSDFPASASFERNDDQMKAALLVDYRIDKTLKLKTKLQFTDNESTVDQYDYDKTTISLGVSKQF